MGRCCNPKNEKWKNYGGRGVTVCDRWRLSFDDFLADMGERPSILYSIDRDDVNGHYEPGNCRWATNAEQCENRTDTIWVDWRGGRRKLIDVIRETGAKGTVVRSRLAIGWPLARALEAPIRGCLR